MTFTQLGLSSTITKGLEALGYERPTPVQSQAIPVILAGKDIMAGAQTGTGKTAAFALPVIETLQTSSEAGVKCLVLTPTRELAQQVYQSFCTYSQSSELKVVVAYGGVSLNVQIKGLAEGADILVATPGRLLDLLARQALSLQQLNYLILDEADRMLVMGFQEEINRILKQVPAQRQTLLFSATFDASVFDFSRQLLRDLELIEVDQRNQAASQVEQAVYIVDEDRKRELLSYMIGSKNWRQVLVFTRTKQKADELVKELKKDGIKGLAIHGDKSQGAREKALEEFKQGQIRVLVATDVAARGLDIQQLEYVINYELPYNAEDYIHRIGRTGRAGLDGLAVSLVSPGEDWLLEEIDQLLEERLPQQWYPGFEPDLTKKSSSSKNNSRGAQKKADQTKRQKQKWSQPRQSLQRPKSLTSPLSDTCS